MQAKGLEIQSSEMALLPFTARIRKGTPLDLGGKWEKKNQRGVDRGDAAKHVYRSPIREGYIPVFKVDKIEIALSVLKNSRTLLYQQDRNGRNTNDSFFSLQNVSRPASGLVLG